MWNCCGMMGGWGWINAFSLIMLALTVGGLWLVRRPDTGRSTTPGPLAGSAAAVLAERYARGEIDEQEYQQRLVVVRSGTPGPAAAMYGHELKRRALCKQLAALGLLTTTGAVLTGCGEDDGSMPMMNGGMMDPAMMADMATIHQLLASHYKIRRSVEDIDGGIRSTTTSDDPNLASLIAEHVAAMRTRLADNRPIRQGDPLFREIFKHHADITITVDRIDGGVQVTETSANPQAILLIRQHARAAVSQFVAGGMNRAMQPTSLPDGYRA